MEQDPCAHLPFDGQDGTPPRRKCYSIPAKKFFSLIRNFCLQRVILVIVDKEKITVL